MTRHPRRHERCTGRRPPGLGHRGQSPPQRRHVGEVASCRRPPLGQRAQCLGRHLQHRCAAVPQVTWRLSLVHAHREDEVGLRDPAQLEVARLQADGRPVVPALPVEHALGAPRVEDAEAPGRRERTQRAHCPALHDAGPGQHHHPARPCHLVEERLLGLDPVLRGQRVAPGRREQAARGRAAPAAGCRRRAPALPPAAPARAASRRPRPRPRRLPSPRASRPRSRHNEGPVAHVRSRGDAVHGTVGLGQQHRHRRVGDLGHGQAVEGAAVGGTDPARREDPGEEQPGRHPAGPVIRRRHRSGRSAATVARASRRTRAGPPPGRGGPTWR